MQLVTLADAAATQSLGAALGRIISAGVVLLLKGDLGSGKTTFVQGLGAALGVEEPVVSPTFALIHEYPEAQIPLYHLDLYRLQPDETAALHLEDYWEGAYPAGVVAIEWPERLKYLPPAYLSIHLSVVEAGRLAQVEAVGSLPQQALQAWIERAPG
jgi:tRNA threonylcarbamoyladenosine biosynthesis protein TsaE